MADQTCLEYLIQCAGCNKQEHITQDILLNASNEFRNIWNLVKKLQSVARIDVKKITRFLDNVQEGLETKKWEAAKTHSVYAEHEYRQIKKYIRDSYLEDYKVAKFIDTATSHGKSKSQKDPSVHQRRKQTFRNMQINKQQSIKLEKQVSADSQDNKSSQNTKVQSKTTVERREVGDGQEKTNTDNAKITGGKTKGVVTRKDKSDEIESLNFVQSEGLHCVQANALNNNGEDRSAEQSAVTMLVENAKTNDQQSEQEQNGEREIREQFKIANSGNEDHQKVDTVTDSKPITEETISVENNIKHRNDKSSEDKNQDQLRSSIDVNVIDQKSSNTSEATDRENGEKVNRAKQTIAESQGGELETLLENKSKPIQSPRDTTGPPTDRSMSTTKQKIAETLHSMKTNDKYTNDPTINETQTEHTRSGKVVEFTNQVLDRLTSISVESNIDEIVEEVAVVFKQDWEQSFKSLTSCEPSNGLKNSISFLGEILKVSAEKVKKATDTMRKTAESNTGDINNKLHTQKEDFLRIQLRNIRDKFCISNNNPDGTETVNTYAAKCVELAWFMSAQSPPLVFDYESRPMLLEDLFKLFKPYKNKGKFIQFVVWPAIRRSGTGEVIEKGIAEFR